MLKIKIDGWRKPSTKIIVTVFTALFLLSAYFIVYIDYHYLDVAETKSLDRLHAIAKTVAMQINGDKHRYLAETYTKPGRLKSNTQDTVYYDMWQILRRAQNLNHLKAEISTLVLDEKEKKFYFIVNSKDTPYVRDPYIDYHKEFLNDYRTGNVIPQYSDEYGTWLTAFSPIFDSKGEVTGIVEVDESFDEFIGEARKKLLTNLMISVLFFIITVVVLLRYIRVILVAEEESKREIEKSNQLITQKNKDIFDSINYARRIQTAILAPKEEVFEVFNKAFILYKPKDIVSGDFYYFAKSGSGAVIAAVDCTGHGVPGALMSMIGNDVLNHVVRDRRIEKPSEILDLLHAGVTAVLKQDSSRTDTRDGMDIALLRFDSSKRHLQYAGAYRPLFVVRKGELMEYKANKFPIGNAQQERSSFDNNEITLESGDMCYIFTDGYADQFGGNKGKKFMMKNFGDVLKKASTMDIAEQEKYLDREFEQWKNDHEQVDDVLVIGIRI
jgi:serine phosphatase RsbU (regulator of sigma subunit)